VGPRNIAPDVVVGWPDGLQPLIDYGRRDAPARWVPTGGDAMAVGTLELQMPLPALGISGWDGYSLAVFGDIGQAWLLDPNARPDSSSDAVDPLVPAWRYGVGGGVRVATPIGPLQLDVAANPQSILAEGAQAQLLRVLYEEPPVRAHLTLGATF
jgi:outer membrane protein assembly factor BamA